MLTADLQLAQQEKSISVSNNVPVEEQFIKTS